MNLTSDLEGLPAICRAQTFGRIAAIAEGATRVTIASHERCVKKIAAAMQVRATEWTPYIHLGQWVLVSAARKNVTGFIVAGPTVFWNVEKK
jgi:hypothetical protein